MSNQSLLLTFAVAIFVGGALKDFFQSIISNLVTPFLVVLMPEAQEGVSGLTVQVGPVKLKIGEVIGATVTLVIALFVTAAAMPYLRAYSPIQGGKRA
jgi:large-conductance mechanosensitive channel